MAIHQTFCYLYIENDFSVIFDVNLNSSVLLSQQ